MSITTVSSVATTSLSSHDSPQARLTTHHHHQNPFDSFIQTYNTPELMAKAYDLHRQLRNKDRRVVLQTQRAVSPDMILRGLVLDHQPPEFDPRNCVTVWCRPTKQVINLVSKVQSMLQRVEPDIWLMPAQNLHMTALEILHSAGNDSVEAELLKIRPYLTSLLAPNPSAVLVKPVLSFDQSALALSFLPDTQIVENEEWYSYHHYRKDLFDIVQKKAQVPVQSRYQVPSAHVTIARFVKPLQGSMDDWLATLEEINDWLVHEGGKDIVWRIGEERGSECRCGRIWYGGGWSEGIGYSLRQKDDNEVLWRLV
ncbi:RNA ligase/cyclic nucleotide phosphodiesterase [Lipomyces japonicus]|uniref:RNA ligase/cyclic nucleotide phosphodiesterase n=1 Tax=Lipomyces japonicus TaxID=56871 RepID=UPI0034CE4CC6